MLKGLYQQNFLAKRQTQYFKLSFKFQTTSYWGCLVNINNILLLNFEYLHKNLLLKEANLLNNLNDLEFQCHASKKINKSEEKNEKLETP